MESSLESGPRLKGSAGHGHNLTLCPGGSFLSERHDHKKDGDVVAGAQKRPSDTSTGPSGSHPPADSVVLPSLYKEMLEAFARLQEQVQQRTVGLASAAHELKTPLAIIGGYIEHLLSEKPGPLNDPQRRALKDAHSNCKRLQRFIQDFLAYSALETGKITMRFEPGDIRACLSEVNEIWLPLFQEKGIALYFLCPDNLEPFSFDYFKVQQIVSNFLENARKFTPSSGTVWISVEMYHWDRRAHEEGLAQAPRPSRARDEPNSVRVTVADTGPGISPEYLQEVFDDFFRVPQKGDSSEGAGLGLAIARRLVHAHRGKIWVESEPGAGSKFCFLLPLTPQ
jgi:signal transduction histidine kinase